MPTLLPRSRQVITPLRIESGTRERSQRERMRRISWRISTFIGQTISHLPHRVHFHGQSLASSSSLSPNRAMRTILRGSRSSTPEIGQAPAQEPQVRQVSARAGEV